MFQAQQSYAQAAAAQVAAASHAIEAPPAYGAAYPPQQAAYGRAVPFTWWVHGSIPCTWSSGTAYASCTKPGMI